jgi:ribosome modulation factor
MRATEFHKAQERQMQDLGRQAYLAGYPKESCNLSTLNYLRGHWLAAWHDADIEAGNRITNFHPITKQEAA